MKNVKNYLMLLMFMVVGVLGFGFSSSAETYVDWKGNPKTLEKLDNPYVNENGEEIVYKKLQIKKVNIVPTAKYGSGGQGKADDVVAYVDRGTITNEVYATTWRMIDVNTGEVYRYGGDWIKSNNKAYWDGCKIECLPKRFTGTFYMQMRFEVGTDEYGNNGKYSEWSDPYYFVTQPTMLKKKKGDVKNSSIKVRWKKLKGDYTYIIYARKRQVNKVGYKWYKVGSTKKSTFTFSKINKKKINCKKYKYHVRVVAQAKLGGKTIKSTCNTSEPLTYMTYKK